MVLVRIKSAVPYAVRVWMMFLKLRLEPACLCVKVLTVMERRLGGRVVVKWMTRQQKAVVFCVRINSRTWFD